MRSQSPTSLALSLILLASLLAPSCSRDTSSGPAAPTSTAAVMMPEEGDTRVIEFNETLGSEASLYVKQSGPRLLLYADGRVRIHDPYGLGKVEPEPDHVAFIDASIEPEAVEELLHFIATDRFLDTDSQALYDAHEDFQSIADAGTTSVTIQGADRRHQVWVYALDEVGESMEDPRVQHMLLVRERLSALRERIIEAHQP